MQALTPLLGLKSKLPLPEDKLEMVPFFNGLLIALLLYALGTSFFFAQGTAIRLPVGEESVIGQPADALLTVAENQLMMMDGHLFSLKGLDGALRSAIGRIQNARPTLLVKADREVDMQIFLQICDSAQRVGFSQIQLAADRSGIVTSEQVWRVK